MFSKTPIIKITEPSYRSPESYNRELLIYGDIRSPRVAEDAIDDAIESGRLVFLNKVFWPK